MHWFPFTPPRRQVARAHRRWVLRPLAVGGVSALALGAAAPAASAQGAEAPVSVEAFYTLPSLIGTEARSPVWAPDNQRVAFLWNDDGGKFLDLWLTDTRSATPTRLTRLPRRNAPANPGADTLALRAAEAAELDRGAGAPSWHPDGERILFNFRGQLLALRPGAEPQPFAPHAGSIQRPSFSSDGRAMAWISRGDVWWAPLEGDSLGAPRRVTSLAAAGTGVERFAWSPDGRHFAIIETARGHIPRRGIPDYLGEDTEMREVTRNFPGEDAEYRRVALVSREGGDVRWLALDAERTDLYFTLDWSPRGDALLVETSDVFVKHRRLLLVDPATAAVRTLVAERDTMNVSAEWRTAWAPDGRGVYFTSDRAYDYHVWYAPRDGAAPRAITSGEWAVFGFTATPQGLYVVGNAGRPEERHLVRVPLNGGEATRLSVRPGTHSPTVSADGRWAADLFSSDTIPPELYLTDLGARRRDIAVERRVTQSPRAAFARYDWVTPRYVSFPSRADGATLHARLQLPPAYQPGRRYPVIIGSVYSNTVRNQWGGRNAHPLWGLDRVLLERGYVILAVDVAGSSGHGREFRRRIRLDYGGIDVEDLHSGVEWLVAQGIADPARVGIWGSSYGGLLTTMSLFTKPGVYAAGIAGAPATNVFHALTGEQRVMMRPQERRAEYISASSHTKAAGLQDALMLIHGMRDPVVLFKDSVWLTQYLLQMGKDVDFVVLPDAGHGWDLESDVQTRFAFNKMLEFFDRHLKP